MNNVQLLGRLTAKPELRTTTNGKKTVNFTLAVPRKGKDAGTDFVRLVAWEKTAELIAQHFDKGQQMAVDAALRTKTVTDKENKRRTVMDVVVDQVYFSGSKAATPSDDAVAADIAEEQGDYEENA